MRLMMSYSRNELSFLTTCVRILTCYHPGQSLDTCDLRVAEKRVHMRYTQQFEKEKGSAKVKVKSKTKLIIKAVYRLYMHFVEFTLFG